MSLVGKYFVGINLGVGDSHIVHFYKVLRETPASVKLQRVEMSTISSENHGYYNEVKKVVPSDTPYINWQGKEEICTKRLNKKYNSVRFEFFNARLWTGEPVEHYNFH